VTLNGAAVLFGFIASIREKQLVAFTLMVAFAVIMRFYWFEREFFGSPGRTSMRRPLLSTPFLCVVFSATFVARLRSDHWILQPERTAVKAERSEFIAEP